MKKAIAIILVLISMLSLFACGGDDTPSGMQLASGSESDGYCFYVPEEWTISNNPGISIAYVSTITSTSVSFAEINSSEFEYDPEQITEKDYFLTQYFYKAISEFPEKVKPTNVSGGEKIEREDIRDIGENQAEEHRPDGQSKYIFQYEHKNGDYYFTYRFTQIYIVKGERYYVMQYFGVAEKYTKADDGTREMMDFDDEYDNDKYLEKFESCRVNLKLFNTPKKDNGAVEGGSDEFEAVSDSKLAGFTMYAPKTFKVDLSNAIVSLTASDGANVTVTEAVGLNVNANTYMMQRKDELLQIVTDFKWITELTTDSNGNEVLTYNARPLGNLPKRDNDYNWSLVFEYTYTYCGKTYHVLQILATDVSVADAVLNQPKGYVFTYTAEESIYEQHISEVDEMIKRIEF